MVNDFIDTTDVGVVVIGRNEGERLRKCLTSVLAITSNTVYVDSGSEDESVDMAMTMGVCVLPLDMTLPFTAARARNAGFESLRDFAPNIEFVQFVDGDCEVVDGWFTSAIQFLRQNQGVAVVCGRRRERFPDKTVYNMLCDIEWDTPVGEAKACGGDAMMRVDALEKVGGFRENLIAGEEPELCVRLRQQGWKIWRLEVEMTLHDAAMSTFNQWWKRTTRAGYAFAEGAYIHGKLPDQHWVRETRSAWIWGLLIPLATIFSLYIYSLWGLLLLMAYPLQVLKLTMKSERGLGISLLRAFFMVLGKFPEMSGAIKFFLQRTLNADRKIIEYK